MSKPANGLLLAAAIALMAINGLLVGAAIVVLGWVAR